jgi:hypothetical protein
VPVDPFLRPPHGRVPSGSVTDIRRQTLLTSPGRLADRINDGNLATPRQAQGDRHTMRIDSIRASLPPDDDGTQSFPLGGDLPGIQPGASTAWAGAEHDRDRRQTVSLDADPLRTARPDRPAGRMTAGRTALF